MDEDGLIALFWGLVALCLVAVFMAARAVWTAMPDDVPSGSAPSMPVWPFLWWSVLAVLAGTAAAFLRSIRPEPEQA